MLEQSPAVSGATSVPRSGDSRRNFLQRAAIASGALAMRNLLNLDTFAGDPTKKEVTEVWPKVSNLPPIDYVGVHGPERSLLEFGPPNAEFHYEINRKKLLFPASIEIVSLRKFT